MNYVYMNIFSELASINQYLNREVLRKEILRDELLNEVGIFRKPSKQMMSVALKFAKEVNSGADPLVAYSKIVGPPDTVSADTLNKLRRYAKKKGMRVGKIAGITKSGPDGGLAIYSNKDKKNVFKILSTLTFLDKTRISKDKKIGPILSKFFSQSMAYNTNSPTDSPIKFSPYQLAKARLSNYFAGKSDFTKLNDKNSSIADFVMLNSSNKITRSHELGHAALGDYGNSLWGQKSSVSGKEIPEPLSQEIQADRIGAWGAAGMNDTVSDSRAIKIANDWYNHLTYSKGLKSILTKRRYDANEKDLIKDVVNLIDDSIPVFENILKSAKTNSKKKRLQNLIQKFKKDKQMFLTTKPVRYVKGIPVYPGRITRLIYGLYSSGLGKVHPHHLVRANFILNSLRPDLFDETGRNIKTGEYVDFSIKGQLVRTLARAKTVGKRQYKVAVGRLKRALGKFGTTVKNKIASWFGNDLPQPAFATENRLYKLMPSNYVLEYSY